MLDRIAGAVDEAFAATAARRARIGCILDRLGVGDCRRDEAVAASADGDRQPVARMERIGRVGLRLDRAIARGAEPDDDHPGRTAVVLAAAQRPGGTRPSELIRLTTLSSGSITAYLDQLEGRGLVRRVRGLRPDRRAVRVHVTPAGSASADRLLAGVEDVLVDLRCALSA